MDFQGLQNTLPALFLVLAITLICILSWYTYKKYTTISVFNKVLLGTLRGLALLILLVLILNPFFKEIEEIEIKPKVAIILDGSESTRIKKGDYSGLPAYQKIIAGLRNSPDNVELDFYSFGSTIQIEDPDRFNPNYSATNLFNAIETITTSDEEYVSGILVSDGIITTGKNPVIQASNSPFPIHVVGIGDTSKVQDISVQNISTNATGFTNTIHNIQTDVAQYGFDNQEVEVNLKSSNLLLESKKINLIKDKEIETVNFEIELNSTGLQQYSIEVEPIAGEWIADNNNSSFSIEVLDSKKRIMHIASQVHPDVKSLRAILKKNENIELSTYTYLGNKPPLTDFFKPNTKFDLIIFHGYPPPSILQELNITSREEISTLFISLPGNSNYLPDAPFTLIQNDSPKLFNVQLSIVEENSDHPILNLPEINLITATPILSYINSIAEYPDALPLLGANYQNIATNSPVVSVLEQGNVRRSQLNASGWFKMYISQSGSEREFLITLISNLVDWASSSPDNRLLKIKPAKNVFNSDDTPIINASLINETGEVEAAAVIEITVSGENYTANFTMKNLNNGSYELQIPNLTDGKYSFSATARKGNREIDTQTGEFLISESNIELSNTIRNDDLLTSIAINSGGKFLDFTSANDIWALEEISSALTFRSETRESYNFPVRSIYWFIVILILLGTEWLLRKKYALP